MKSPTTQFIASSLVFLLTGASAFAGDHNQRSSARGNVNQSSNRNTNVNNNRNTNVNSNRNTNVNTNRNTNVNVNRNRDVNVNVHGGNYGGGCCYHSGVGVAAAVATTAAVTAAVVGTRVTVLPPSCTTVIANGVTYSQCGGAYYQPQFVGGNTSYVVVNNPL